MYRAFGALNVAFTTKPLKAISIVVGILSYNTWKILPFLLSDFQYCYFFLRRRIGILAAIAGCNRYRFTINVVFSVHGIPVKVITVFPGKI